jgi:hypothetical protein
MRRPAKARSRTLLSGFSSRFGSETLNVRIYRDRKAFVCERELVERDGTSFTMVLPFKEPDRARELLTSDPYYPKVRAQVGRALGTLDKALREHHGKRAA